MTAIPAQVWAELSDHEGMARWTPHWLPVPKVSLEREGTPDRNGVDAVRRLGLGGPIIRERVTDFQPNQRLAYEALSGVPARNYTGEIVLTPSGTGTRIEWTIDSTPAFPGAQLVFHAAIGAFARALARRCNR